MGSSLWRTTSTSRPFESVRRSAGGSVNFGTGPGFGSFEVSTAISCFLFGRAGICGRGPAPGAAEVGGAAPAGCEAAACGRVTGCEPAGVEPAGPCALPCGVPVAGVCEAALAEPAGCWPAVCAAGGAMPSRGDAAAGPAPPVGPEARGTTVSTRRLSVR
jgi:hypothetical protein